MSMAFKFCRVSADGSRASKLQKLADELKKGSDRSATEILSELFAARVEASEISGLELGGRDGVLDTLRKTGSAEEQRLAKKCINAWNSICKDASKTEERLRAAAGAARPTLRKRATSGESSRDGKRRTMSEAESEDASVVRLTEKGGESPRVHDVIDSPRAHRPRDAYSPYECEPPFDDGEPDEVEYAPEAEWSE